MRFALLALGDVDGRTGQPDDHAFGIAQGLDMEIIPADLAVAFDPVFGVARLAIGQHIAFGGHNSGPVGRRNDDIVAVTEHVLRGETE